MDNKELEKLANEAIKTAKENHLHCTTHTGKTDNGTTWYATAIGSNYGYGVVCGCTESREDFIPTKVIFNAPATICYFPDGTKTVVKCADDEEFCEEEGVMACIIKKLFASRNQFKKLVKEAYRQPKEEKKPKEVSVNINITVDGTFAKQESSVIEKQIEKALKTGNFKNKKDTPIRE